MTTRYFAKYIDDLGEENTLIHNDGKILRMNVRNVEFSGDDFDSLQSDEQGDILSNCQIKCEIPIQLIANTDILEGMLKVWIDLRNSTDHPPLQIKLNYSDKEFISTGMSNGFFDEELWNLQKLLPQGVYFKTCLTCKLSNIGRYEGMFGALGCYRGSKDEYFKIMGNQNPHTKYNLLDIVTEDVQETYLCSEFVMSELSKKSGEIK